MSSQHTLKVKAILRGSSAIMFDKPDDDLLERLRTGEKKARARGADVPSKEDQAAARLYRNQDGRAGITREMLFSCLRHGGRNVKMDGRSKVSTATSTKLPSFLTIDDDFFPFVGDPEWRVDMRRGTNPNGGEMVVLVRPRFDEWMIEVNLTLRTDTVGPSIAKQVLETAGRTAGLGSFRPQKGGPFGMFEVVEWIALSDEQIGTNGAMEDVSPVAETLIIG